MSKADSIDFIRINVPLISDAFNSALTDKMSPEGYAAYRVVAIVDGNNAEIPRIGKADQSGTLTIGHGSFKRLQRLASSIGKKPLQHHFGLKYSQVKPLKIIPSDDCLFLEIHTCNSSEDALELERKAQKEYRDAHGENPPYAGRWEG